jgi:hypothetical protein
LVDALTQAWREPRVRGQASFGARTYPPADSAISSQRGEVTPQEPAHEPDRVDGVRHIGDDADQASEEPDGHEEHGALIDEKARLWIEPTSDPDVSEQGVNHAGHADEVGAADDELAEIGESRDDQDEDEVAAHAAARFVHGAQIFEPKHVEEQMQNPAMQQDGRE